MRKFKIFLIISAIIMVLTSIINMIINHNSELIKEIVANKIINILSTNKTAQS